METPTIEQLLKENKELTKENEELGVNFMMETQRLQDELFRLREENERLKARPSLMDKENDNLIKELGRRDERIKALTEQVEKLKGDLRSKSDSYDECWQDYTAERARANHAVEKMNEAKAKVSELTMALNEEQRKVKTLEADSAALLKELKKWADDRDWNKWISELKNGA